MTNIRAYHVGVVWIDAEKRVLFEPLCEFPADAEHVHVTIINGTVTAVPMRRDPIVIASIQLWRDASRETPA